MGNAHKPRLRVHVTKVHTERQTQTLPRRNDPITPLRLKHVDDIEEMKKTPENASTADEDIIQTKRKTRKGHAAAQFASVDDAADVDPHDPYSEPEDDATSKTPPNTKEAATTQTATTPSTKSQTTIQNMSQNCGGRLHSENNAQSG